MLSFKLTIRVISYKRKKKNQTIQLNGSPLTILSNWTSIQDVVRACRNLGPWLNRTIATLVLLIK